MDVNPINSTSRQPRNAPRSTPKPMPSTRSTPDRPTDFTIDLISMPTRVTPTITAMKVAA